MAEAGAGGGRGGACFALPPSLGLDTVRVLARRFADVLYDIGFDTVQPTKSYLELERALLDGTAHAAWGPPSSIARIEAAGGTVALRGVRNGSVTYRAALVCRSYDDIDLRRIGGIGGRDVRAVWVDSWSMAGYILPRAYLRNQGLDPATVFIGERTLGSYQACFEAVLDRQADLTASFAGRRGLGYVELCAERAAELRTLAYTDECPNDAVVLSARFTAAEAARLGGALRELLTERSSAELLASMFDVDGFDEPPPGTYRTLLSLLD
jgi:phosphonate transport system substrate-binding protein